MSRNVTVPEGGFEDTPAFTQADSGAFAESWRLLGTDRASLTGWTHLVQVTLVPLVADLRI